MATKRKLTHQEKRRRMEAWLRRADEVLAEYAEPTPGEGVENGTDPKDAA